MSNDNRPINPLKAELGQGKSMNYFGLTKREYFAGLAMQATDLDKLAEEVAKDSVIMADTLLKELEQ